MRHNDQVHRAGASPFDEQRESDAPAPVQPLVRLRRQLQTAICSNTSHGSIEPYMDDLLALLFVRLNTAYASERDRQYCRATALDPSPVDEGEAFDESSVDLWVPRYEGIDGFELDCDHPAWLRVDASHPVLRRVQ